MRKLKENVRRDSKGKIIYPYNSAPGGRIEIRFKEVNDKEMSDAFIAEIIKKTGMKRDKIMYQALMEFNKKFDEKGNRI